MSDLHTLQALADRLAAATGPDREADGLLWGALVAVPPCADPGKINASWPPYTASLDAALSLVEAKADEIGMHAVDVLYEALDALTRDGWRPNQPTAPQLANHALRALIAALMEQSNGQG